MDDNICRLCGQPRAIPPRGIPVKKEKHQSVIAQILGIDVLTDLNHVPPYICGACVTKLKKAKDIKAKKKSGIVNWNVPVFPEPQCEVMETDKAILEQSQHAVPAPINNVQQIKRKNFSNFLELLHRECSHRNLVDLSADDIAVVAKLETKTADTVFKLEVDSDFKWRLYFRGILVRRATPGIISFPDVLDENSLPLLLDSLLMNTCTGNANTEFPNIVNKCFDGGKTVLLGKDQKSVVGYTVANQIHSMNCTVFPENGATVCEMCWGSFRSNLRARESIIRKNAEVDVSSRIAATSKCPISRLNEKQKVEKMQNMSHSIKNLKRKITRLESKVKSLLEKDAVPVDGKQHAILNDIIKENESSIFAMWPSDSPQRILWEQQLKFLNTKSSNGMRWHPLMIRWCVSLYAKSPAAYRQLAQSGFLHLPHVSTLTSYMKFAEATPDINPEVIAMIVEEIGVESMKDYEKNVCLVWDEMRVKSGLVMEKGSGKLVGFCALDNFNEELQKLSKLSTEGEPEPAVASHIIVFMVRGIMAHYNTPFVWYPCKGFSAEDLVSTVWVATRTLEDLGLVVRAWVCDGASPNRKFFRTHREIGTQYLDNTYKIKNIYCSDREIYFICDVPHLLKTTRNNIENSHGHTNTKSLMKNGQSISWSDIVSTVEEDQARQLNRLNKVKEEHIHLSPQLRMRVRLAAQILSSSMANAIEARDRPHMSETANFCRMFNKWFDCLNGRYLKESRDKRNLNLRYYDDINDPRLAWLDQDFLGWILEWENEIQNLQDLSQSEKNKFLLSYQTIEGLRITTKSSVELIRKLLSENESEGRYILPEKLNQDKLEIFFSKLRRSVGDGDNPTVSDASHRFLSLLLTKSQTVAPRHGNCQATFDRPQENGYRLKRYRKK